MMLVIVDTSAGGMTDGPGRNCTCESAKKRKTKRLKRVTMALLVAAPIRTKVVANRNRYACNDGKK